MYWAKPAVSSRKVFFKKKFVTYRVDSNRIQKIRRKWGRKTWHLSISTCTPVIDWWVRLQSSNQNFTCPVNAWKFRVETSKFFSNKMYHKLYHSWMNDTNNSSLIRNVAPHLLKTLPYLFLAFETILSSIVLRETEFVILFLATDSWCRT